SSPPSVPSRSLYYCLVTRRVRDINRRSRYEGHHLPGNPTLGIAVLETDTRKRRGSLLFSPHSSAWSHWSDSFPRAESQGSWRCSATRGSGRFGDNNLLSSPARTPHSQAQ